MGDDGNTEGTRMLTRTWYVEDRCGNIGEATQTITVTDDTAPMGSVEDDSVACASYDAATEYGSHSESDNCDSNVAVSWSKRPSSMSKARAATKWSAPTPSQTIAETHLLQFDHHSVRQRGARINGEMRDRVLCVPRQQHLHHGI